MTTVQYSYALNSSELLTQRPVNFYTTTDSNFVFEFTPMNVSASYNVMPIFQPYIETDTNIGFIDVSATAYLTCPAVNFSRLFMFESNDARFANYPNQDISYGIDNASTTFSLEFSQALIKSGWANAATIYQSNTSLDQDYVRYTAKAITGGYALTDIFQNEEELILGVDSLDDNFNALLNYNISTHYNNFSNSYGMGSYPDSSDNPYVLSCKQLLEYLITNASTTRGTQFLDDIGAQSDAYDLLYGPEGTRRYYIEFHEGDVMAVRLAYEPMNVNDQVAGDSGNLLGDNKLYTRTYKVFIKFT
jgi:hypothetical protein